MPLRRRRRTRKRGLESIVAVRLWLLHPVGWVVRVCPRCLFNKLLAGGTEPLYKRGETSRVFRPERGRLV
jgi:hypothetical protein